MGVVPRWQRRAATVGGLLFTAFALGCMSLSFGGRTEVVPADGPCGAQTGQVNVPGQEEAVIYYPVPYLTPPNLVLDAGCVSCRIVDQKPDHFRVKNLGAGAELITWKSRGLKAGPGGCVPAVMPTAEPPPAVVDGVPNP